MARPSGANGLARDQSGAERGVELQLSQRHHPGMGDAVPVPTIADAPDAVAVFAQAPAVGTNEEALGVGAKQQLPLFNYGNQPRASL